MEIEISEQAEKQINRFKNISIYDIEEFIQREIDSEDYQNFLDNCNSSICNEFYDKENHVTVFSKIDFDREILTVTGIKKENLVGKDFTCD